MSELQGKTQIHFTTMHQKCVKPQEEKEKQLGLGIQLFAKDHGLQCIHHGKNTP